MVENFGEVLVPTHDVTEIKKGKRTVAKENIFQDLRSCKTRIK